MEFLNVLALCSGTGGFERGLSLAAPATRVVCHVEREAYPASLMAAHMGFGTMDAAPIWSDVRTFDGRPWRGVVDFILAGFPCQPHSGAGRQRGTDDERWIWPDIDRIIREVGPEWVFLENVQPLVRSGIDHVLGSLAECGFDAEWDVFSAGEVGAPHQRERLFILAHARRCGISGPGVARHLRGTAGTNEGDEAPQRQRDGDAAGDAGPTMADAEHAEHDGRDGRSPAAGRRADDSGSRCQPERRGGDVADSSSGGLRERRQSSGRGRQSARGSAAMADPVGTGRRAEQPQRGSDGRAAAWGLGEDGDGSDVGHADVAGLERRQRPDRRSADKRAARAAGSPLADPDTDGLGVEWGIVSGVSVSPSGGDADGRSRALAPFPPGPGDLYAWRQVPPDLEPAVCRVAYGVADRRHRLRAAGNGVVPLVVAFAFITLARRLGFEPPLDHLYPEWAAGCGGCGRPGPDCSGSCNA